jgi:CobQ-like glutamine amidotransferase family enzyme
VSLFQPEPRDPRPSRERSPYESGRQAPPEPAERLAPYEPAQFPGQGDNDLGGSGQVGEPVRYEPARYDQTQPIYQDHGSYPGEPGHVPGHGEQLPARGQYAQEQQFPADRQPRRFVEPRFETRQLFEPPSSRALPARAPARAAHRFDGQQAASATGGSVPAVRESATRIALIYPELLGTYGDGGNAIVLRERLRWRGLSAEVVSVPAGEPIPAGCDLYLLGGGEDEPQTLAAEGLRRNNAIQRAVEGGAVVLAVCAGYQVIGQSFPAGGKIHDGLGLVGVETRRSFDRPDAPVPPRVVGDIALDPHPSLRLPTVLGYENHAGRTRPVPGARGVPFGKVLVGLGNGIEEGTDGMVDGTVIGTYLHGPVLAQNPALADLLLTWVHGPLPPLSGPPEVEALRAARVRALQLA